MPTVIVPSRTPSEISSSPRSVRVTKRSGCRPKSAMRPARTRNAPSEASTAAPSIHGRLEAGNMWPRSSMPSRPSCAPSQPHVKLVHQLVVGQLLARAPLVLDPAVHDDVAAVGDADRLVEVLLGHEHREPVGLLQLPDLVDGVDDEYRRKTDRRLVDQQDLGRGHQGTSEMPRSTICSGALPTRSCSTPSMMAAIRPALGGTMPMMHFMSVLLPLPLVPSSVTVSPSFTASEMRSSTCTEP